MIKIGFTWLFKLINEEDAWQSLLKRKYLSNKILSQDKRKPKDSHICIEYGHFQSNSNTKIRFWKDTWMVDKPLQVVYPNIYQIVRKKDATVA